MSRAYRGVRPKQNRVYSVDDVLKLYGICRNTLSNWVRDGLRPSPGSGPGPQLFRGSELARFHLERKARSKTSLRHGEFKCLHCKAVVVPEPSDLELWPGKTVGCVALATCPDCDGRTTKIVSETECNKLRIACERNTSLYHIVKEAGPIPDDIGTIPQIESCPRGTVNDAILYDWQLHAGRYDGKTADAHLCTIREFEAFLEAKPFDKLTDKDVARFRDRQVVRAREDVGPPLSVGTVRHKMSYLHMFLVWLRGQKGYRRLSGSLADGCALPKAFGQAPINAARPYPTLDEANEMVQSMPSATLLQRRDRAMVAFAFISCLRAAALTTLRWQHVDLVNKRVTQDARTMRAKNGKSFVVQWFPWTEPLQEVFLIWAEETRALGFGPEDAVFPAEKDLDRHRRTPGSREPMATETALREAFNRASTAIGKTFAPHSARHCMAAEMDRWPLTTEQRKALSANFGHESMTTTEAHYGKLNDAQRFEVMEGIEDRQDLMAVEESVIRALAYDLHLIDEDHPDYKMAKAEFQNLRAKTQMRYQFRKTGEEP
ncbi:hypothetical protein EU803_13490 [Loktanella sp. IMCC34160]|uniref:tyrosine-type recombinase/integrase n=1 Tax=Loktanella sp. IMCC34160 TaxID=2510646 RepID=UPI00101CF621|nr:tyrosine-type recombinase/integrase [Loktanella sp. IMCC34160]RYG90992.1 hypothetical protein EU803_13490 [Loktanella sp. IMCC34160]